MANPSDSDSWAEHRRVILGGIEALNRSVAEIAKEQSRANTALEGVTARIITRLDDIATWRAEIDRRLRDDVERRLRELEATRSQAIALAALVSVIFGVVAATVARVVVR